MYHSRNEQYRYIELGMRCENVIVTCNKQWRITSHLIVLILLIHDTILSMCAIPLPIPITSAKLPIHHSHRPLPFSTPIPMNPSHSPSHSHHLPQISLHNPLLPFQTQTLPQIISTTTRIQHHITQYARTKHSQNVLPQPLHRRLRPRRHRPSPNTNSNPLSPTSIPNTIPPSPTSIPNPSSPHTTPIPPSTLLLPSSPINLPAPAPSPYLRTPLTSTTNPRRTEPGRLHHDPWHGWAESRWDGHDSRRRIDYDAAGWGDMSEWWD